MTEISPVIPATPSESVTVVSQPNTDEHAVSFSELVEARFAWWTNRANGRGNGAGSTGYDALRVRFEDRNGEIVSAYWCAQVASAVALTEKMRLGAHRFPTWGFHRQTDAAV